MELTKEQQLVVDTRKKNILVSAAAGSGKTRVLVQRIIDEILDENNPIDVDRILVVTFTNAAAAEMRDRIRKEIDSAVNKNPSRADLRRQATLIHNAQIRTIDSFCSWVVKNYFYEIDQDPSFRIGSSGELSMMADQLLDELIASRFESKDEDYRLLADAYITGQKIKPLKEMVLELYKKAMSNPWPLEWFEDAVRLYQVNSYEEFLQNEVLVNVFEEARARFSSLAKKAELLLNLYDPAEAPKDKAIIENEYRCFLGATEAKDFDSLYNIVSAVTFDRYTPNKKALGENIDEARNIRNAYKKDFGKLLDKYFFASVQEAYDNIVFVRSQANALISLTRDFYEEFAKLKKKKNLYDFNDIEHMTLEILRNSQSKEHECRPVANELSKLFAEVMVDEYQDSNRLQEAILTAVCKENDYFTVGDVKQSIYAFRQADPAIFMEKFVGYPEDKDNCLRIDLDRNFRSRGQVLSFCNQVFTPLMQPDMGNVAYDEGAALKIGVTNFPGNPTDYEPEILIAEKNKLEMAELEIKDSDEFEAHIVAGRIKELIDSNFQVTEADKSKEGQLKLRPLKLNDIVILMRATTGHADTFIRVLREYNIPAYVEAETGFFDRDEVLTMLSMLETVDNPNNDIALASVLHSPMYGLTTEELAGIRALQPEGTFYQCIFEYAKTEGCSQKILRFMSLLEEFRAAAIDTPIHDMIVSILDKTGYGSFVSALPMGEMAMANLNKLVDEALKFEASSAKSITRFVGYINNLRTYEEELGLAKTVSENDTAVRIMTIHKSKGLEFPVVFLARAAGGFRNEKGNVFYHPSLGVGLNYKNPKSRVESPTLFANVIKERLKAETLGEEQRILYVALTRAKEKLIIVGNLEPSKEKTVADIVEGYGAMPGQPLDYETKLGAAHYLEWIIRALRASEVSYKRLIISAKDIVISEAERQVERAINKQSIMALYNSVSGDVAKNINEKINYVYHRANESEYRQKYSVSDLKHNAMAENYNLMADAVPAFLKKEKDPYVPSFMREGGVLPLNDQSVSVGALYGTAMHRFLECFDFSVDDIENSVDEQLEFMATSKSMSEDNIARLNIGKLKKFMKSPLAKRMHEADCKGLLYKEQPFVLGSNPKELFDDDSNESTLTLVQGIIDVFFEEPDGIVLMDYKTDRVDEPKDLVLRYEKQLNLYASAIRKATGKEIKEILIYSFSFNETISIGD